MKNMIVAALCVTVPLLSGCATKSADIAPSYVSPMQYQSLNCQQLGAEAQRVAARVRQVSGQQDQKADNDAGMVAVGMVLFWPALIFMQGDQQTAGEVARLKGEMDALEQANIQKNCGIEFRS